MRDFIWVCCLYLKILFCGMIFEVFESWLYRFSLRKRPSSQSGGEECSSSVVPRCRQRVNSFTALPRGEQTISSSTSVQGADRTSQYFRYPTTRRKDRLWPFDFRFNCSKRAKQSTRVGKGLKLDLIVFFCL